MRIEKGRAVIEDTMDNLIETKDGITCGCRIPSLKMTMHIDGVDFYFYGYVCMNCGNRIAMKVGRNDSERSNQDT